MPLASVAASRLALATALIAASLAATEVARGQEQNLLLRVYPPAAAAAAGGDVSWEVYDVAETKDGHILLATQQGLYRLAGNKLAKVEGIKPPVLAVEELHGEVWVGALEGLFRLRSGRPEPISTPGAVALIEEVPSGAVVVSKPDGGLLFPGPTAGGPVPEGGEIRGLRSQLTRVAALPSGVWLGTRDGLYRLTGNTAARLNEGGAAAVSGDAGGAGGDAEGEDSSAGEILAIAEWDSRVWFAVTDPRTSRGATIWAFDPRAATGKASLRRPLGKSYNRDVTYLATSKLAEWLYLGTNSGLYQVERPAQSSDEAPDYHVRPVDGFPGSVRGGENDPVNGLFEEADGTRYVVTDSRLSWLREVELSQAPPPAWPGRLRLLSGEVFAGKPWVWGGGGAFRLEKGARIEVSFAGDEAGGVWRFPSDLLKVENLRLLDEAGQELQPLTAWSGYQLEVSFGPAGKSAPAEPVAASELNKPLACGERTASFVVRDRYHNESRGRFEYACGELQPAPWWRLPARVAGCLVAMFALFNLLLAGTWGFARKLLDALLRAGWAVAGFVRFFMRFRRLRGFPLHPYRLALEGLEAECLQAASAPSEAERDGLRQALSAAVGSPRSVQSVNLGTRRAELWLGAASQLVRGAEFRRQHPGWYPLVVDGKPLRNIADPKLLLAALFNRALSELQERGKLTGPSLAKALLEEGTFLLVVIGVDAALEQRLHEAFPGEPFGQVQCSLVLQMPGSPPPAPANPSTNP